MKDKKEYFVLKGDSSGKLYTRIIIGDEGVYTPIDKPFGFDTKTFSNFKFEPAPIHLIVAARLKGEI